MNSRNDDELFQNREASESSLQCLRREVRNSQLIDLLVDMNAIGALVLREEWGIAEPCWVATGEADHAFADRIFDLDDDQHALVAELFLSRTIGFAVRDQPRLHIWWHTDAAPGGTCPKPN